MGGKKKLTRRQVLSLCYHDIFDFPLSLEEINKWLLGKISGKGREYSCKNGLYFLKGRERTLARRKRRERFSTEKLVKLQRTKIILSMIPSIKMIGVTGALAMSNADESSDIDLIIIVSSNALWTTRVLVYILLKTFGEKVRIPKDSFQKDKLCLNMWLDERDLTWPKKERNVYTAHEISQILPILNRNNTFQRMISKNRWIYKYWPNAVDKKYRVGGNDTDNKVANYFLWAVNYLFYFAQALYMRKRITREVVTATRAVFHPNDLTKKVLSRITLDK